MDHSPSYPWTASYDVGVPSHISYPNIPLFGILEESAERIPDQTALLFYGRATTYRMLKDETDRFASALLGLGVHKGDRVAIMLPNIPQCVIAYYGVLKIGAVVVMTNPLYVEREIQVQMADSNAETLITLDFIYPKIANIKNETALKRFILTAVQDELPWLRRLLYPIKAKREGHWVRIDKIPPIYDLEEMIRNAPPLPPIEIVTAAVRPDDLAQLQYTGGTTGTPKGVMLTHRNLVANLLQCRRWVPGLREGEEVFLGVIPFFHVYGMSVCMNLAIYLGGTLVLLPRFTIQEVLPTLQKTRTTIFIGVQAMYVAINNFSKTPGYDLSSIRLCLSGAGPLHAEVQERFEAITGGKLVEGYGLSESSPVTHVNPITGKRKKGSIGLPLPDTFAKVIDLETGQEVGAGQAGELVVYGPQVMQGYWNKPQETADVLRDGWLATGDIATMDEEGFFFIVDRKKDMIKTRGENVYPREVEEVLYRHPKVKEGVVVGLPDSFSGEIIKAYLVLKEGETATEEEIIQFCGMALSKFKIPRQVAFRSELPKTIIGKVLRRVLLDEERQKGGTI